MLPASSPFPCHWWGTSLEDVGLGDVRPDLGTYGRYGFGRLPPLPFPLTGDLSWLAAAPVHRNSIISNYYSKKFAVDNTGAIKLLRASAKRLGLPLPDAFTKFMETPALQERIRSSTDCFLDLCPEPVPSPLGGGWLVRFLDDSQGCHFWYLYLTADGSDHAVVTSPDLYNTPLAPSEHDELEDEDWEEDPDPKAIAFCAESFEAFLCRYWLENEISFAQCPVKTPMPETAREYIEKAARQYIEQYRRKQ
jgi:hypothetical protein